jgi:hypothetical protein
VIPIIILKDTETRDRAQLTHFISQEVGALWVPTINYSTLSCGCQMKIIDECIREFQLVVVE